MKNNKLKYILILLAIFIWGFVFYRIFTITNDSDFAPIQPAQRGMERVPPAQRDSFSISLGYPDPFLKSKMQYAENKPETTKAQKVETRKIPQKSPSQVNIKWPKISYSGVIINKKTNGMTGIIHIDKKKYLIESGRIYDEVEIKKIFPDSVILFYKESVKTFPKANTP